MVDIIFDAMYVVQKLELHLLRKVSRKGSCTMEYVGRDDCIRRPSEARLRAMNRALELGNGPSECNLNEPTRCNIYREGGKIVTVVSGSEGLSQEFYESVVGDSGYLVESWHLATDGGFSSELRYLDFDELPRFVREFLAKNNSAGGLIA